MKERPILFSGSMVRALLEGTKTQTRRVFKFHEGQDELATELRSGEIIPTVKTCPYGQPGEHLWVKETWRTCRSCDGMKPLRIGEHETIRYEASEEPPGPCPQMGWGRIRQSIFMRRWMSRLTLEITGVRVERLNEISEEDAWAEGITRLPDFGDNINYASWEDGFSWHNYPTARMAYRGLWESIHGPGSWEENPWVWVVEFKRV